MKGPRANDGFTHLFVICDGLRLVMPLWSTGIGPNLLLVGPYRISSWFPEKDGRELNTLISGSELVGGETTVESLGLSAPQEKVGTCRRKEKGEVGEFKQACLIDVSVLSPVRAVLMKRFRASKFRFV